MPAIRECCLASSDARAGWWQEVDELLARFDLWQQERLWYKLFEKVSPPDDDDFEAAMPPANRLEEAVAVLGIAWPCPATELKKAYRQLAKLHHPDLGGKAEGFQRLQHAYELLSRLAA